MSPSRVGTPMALNALAESTWLNPPVDSAIGLQEQTFKQWTPPADFANKLHGGGRVRVPLRVRDHNPNYNLNPRHERGPRRAGGVQSGIHWWYPPIESTDF